MRNRNQLGWPTFEVAKGKPATRIQNALQLTLGTPAKADDGGCFVVFTYYRVELLFALL